MLPLTGGCAVGMEVGGGHKRKLEMRGGREEKKNQRGSLRYGEPRRGSRGREGNQEGEAVGARGREKNNTQLQAAERSGRVGGWMQHRAGGFARQLRKAGVSGGSRGDEQRKGQDRERHQMRQREWEGTEEVRGWAGSTKLRLLAADEL